MQLSLSKRRLQIPAEVAGRNGQGAGGKREGFTSMKYNNGTIISAYKVSLDSGAMKCSSCFIIVRRELS